MFAETTQQAAVSWTTCCARTHAFSKSGLCGKVPRLAEGPVLLDHPLHLRRRCYCDHESEIAFRLHFAQPQHNGTGKYFIKLEANAGHPRFDARFLLDENKLPHEDAEQASRASRSSDHTVLLAVIAE